MLGIGYVKVSPITFVMQVRNGAVRREGVGLIGPGERLVLESQMPDGGAIFSDGVLDDALSFDAGRVATVSAAERQAVLVLDRARTAQKAKKSA